MNLDLCLDKIDILEAWLKPEKSKYILQSFFTCTKSAMLLITPDNRIIFYNKALSDCSELLFGRPPVVGQSILSYRQDNNKKLFAELEKAIQLVVSDNKSITIEHKINYPGVNFRAHLEFTPVYGNDNKVNGIFLNIENISEQKKMEHSNKFQRHQLNQIAWSQSHKTRQPVATILGLISIFDKDSLTPDNLTILNMLQDTVKKLELIIQETVVRANSRLNDH